MPYSPKMIKELYKKQKVFTSMPGPVKPKPHGFTLIELLIASAIIGILSVVSSQIVLSILENQDQAAVVNEIRQNGDSAIVAFERDARKAKEIDVHSSHFVEFQTNDSTNPQILWECDTSPIGEGITRELAELTSSEPNTGVQLVSCNFEATDDPPQIITWEFTLKSKRPDIHVEVPFRTSIQSRIQ